MEDLESYKLWKVLLGIVGFVLLYYFGTRGVLLATQRHAGRWYRHAIVSLSFAALLAPSLAGVGHGGLMPAPAWMVAVQYATEHRWEGFWKAGVLPVLITWAIFFAMASFKSHMSKNKNNKVDTHGKEP